MRQRSGVELSWGNSTTFWGGLSCWITSITPGDRTNPSDLADLAHLLPALFQPPLQCHIHSTPHTHTFLCRRAGLVQSAGLSHSVESVCRARVACCPSASGISAQGGRRPCRATPLGVTPSPHDAQNCPGYEGRSLPGLVEEHFVRLNKNLNNLWDVTLNSG